VRQEECNSGTVALPESNLSSAISRVVYGKDFPSLWAKAIGNQSGFPFTKQEQLELFRDLRMGSMNPDSDQKIYARVLRETDCPAKEFEAQYPHIFSPSRPTSDVDNEATEEASSNFCGPEFGLVELVVNHFSQCL
jgi:hypothetical protein